MLPRGTGSWSPDGKRLACETWDDSNPARNGIYTISSAGGSGLTRLTANPLGGHDVPGFYSPDGKRIVFIRYDANFTSAGMFVVKTNDGQLRQILPPSVFISPGVQADWSPQGIIFVAQPLATGVKNIYTANADGTGLTQVSFGGSDDDPAWGTHPLAQ